MCVFKWMYEKGSLLDKRFLLLFLIILITLIYDTTVFRTQRRRVHAAALNCTSPHSATPCWALLPTWRTNDRGQRRVDQGTYICWALISSTDNSNSFIWPLRSSSWAADSSGSGWSLVSGNTTSAIGAATILGLDSAVAGTGLRSDGEWDCGFEEVCEDQKQRQKLVVNDAPE